MSFLHWLNQRIVLILKAIASTTTTTTTRLKRDHDHHYRSKTLKQNTSISLPTDRRTSTSTCRHLLHYAKLIQATGKKKPRRTNASDPTVYPYLLENDKSKRLPHSAIALLLCSVMTCSHLPRQTGQQYKHASALIEKPSFNKGRIS